MFDSLFSFAKEWDVEKEFCLFLSSEIELVRSFIDSFIYLCSNFIKHLSCDKYCDGGLALVMSKRYCVCPLNADTLVGETEN